MKLVESEMEIVLISELKLLLNALAEEADLYVPKKVDEHHVYARYDTAASPEVELNNIRACVPVKEFLLPAREIAAIYPQACETEETKPFAVFGLKDCGLRSIVVLDKVFAEEEFADGLYLKRREKMFVISSDCFDPSDSCICNVVDGQSFPSKGFDLNVSRVKHGFIVEAGSQKGEDFIKRNSRLFANVTDGLLSERNENREQIEKQLRKNNAELKGSTSVRDSMEKGQDSDFFDVEAEKCVECQACTRVCPTCHCFYLYDAKQKDYFAKMKMWDSCMRMAYASVAGGANPRKVLGERLRHRLLHKFVYFLDRYGIQMCVGCGRCIDAEVGGVDLKEILKRLSA